MNDGEGTSPERARTRLPEERQRTRPVDPVNVVRLTAAALLVLTVVVVLLTALDVSTPLRLPLTLACVILAPGWGIAAYSRPTRASYRWTLAFSAGIAVAVIAGQAMILTKSWHPTAAVYVLVVLSIPLLVHHLVRPDQPRTATPIVLGAAEPQDR